MDERVGHHLGNYRLIRLLGRGGFAEVYLGEHIHLGIQAAIKVLNAQLAQAEIERFREEAYTIAALEHPHIVRVLDFGVEQGTPFLVMSYAPQGTLRQRFPKGTPLLLETVLPYVKQIADALHYAHDHQVIHRDIKPENMLLGRTGEVLLSDFGIATMAQSSRSQSTQDIVGTVAYMAPEQIQGHPRPASDQYALGVVVYEWLTGERPFQGALTELYGQHLFQSPPPLRSKLPDISLALEEVVLTALAKDPKQRFSTVQAFVAALVNGSQAASKNPVSLSRAQWTPGLATPRPEAASRFSLPSIASSQPEPSMTLADKASWQQQRFAVRPQTAGTAGSSPQTSGRALRSQARASVGHTPPTGQFAPAEALNMPNPPQPAKDRMAYMPPTPPSPTSRWRKGLYLLIGMNLLVLVLASVSAIAVLGLGAQNRAPVGSTSPTARVLLPSLTTVPPTPIPSYTPVYTDGPHLVVSAGIYISQIHKLGQPFAASFTVQNIGNRPFILYQLYIAIHGAGIENMDLGGDGNSAPIQPGESRKIYRSTVSLGETCNNCVPGQYIVFASVQTGDGQWWNPPVINNAQSEVSIDVQ